MTPDTKYPHFDYVWIALDSGGRPGAFVTGGEGPIPLAVLREQTLTISQIEDELLKLPQRYEVTMHRSYPKPDSFEALGARGFFVFDWFDVHRVLADKMGAYEKVCSPSAAITVDELSPGLRDYLHRLSPLNADFSREAVIDARTQMECLERSLE